MSVPGFCGIPALPSGLPDAGGGCCCYGAALYGPDRCTCWEAVDPAVFHRIAARCVCGPDGHWIWTGATTRAGHGQVRLNGRTEYTHRAIFAAVFGAIEDQVNHRCGKSGCQNPGHLYDGTQSDNMQDAKRHGTLFVPTPPMRGAEMCWRGHCLDAANTLVHSRASGQVERICRTCHRDRQRGYAREKSR